MSAPTRLCLSLLLGLATLAPLSAASAPATVSPQLQQRIDRLLKRRLYPEPLPVNPPNPFDQNGVIIREGQKGETARTSREGGSAETALERNPTDASLSASNLEILSAIAVRLKIGGLMVLKDRLQVVVNGVPRREGDSIAADWNGTLLYAKIARLSPGDLVLRYADAEVTLKF